MCTVSAIIQDRIDQWQPRVYDWPPTIYRTEPAISPEEIREFRDLLEKAREYDRLHNQPDCEQAEKRQKLLDLAEELGVEIDFV